jgi:hypothetical protein
VQFALPHTHWPEQHVESGPTVLQLVDAVPQVATRHVPLQQLFDWHPFPVEQDVPFWPLQTPPLQVAPLDAQSDVKLHAPPLGTDPAVLHVAPVAIQILLQQFPEIH